MQHFSAAVGKWGESWKSVEFHANMRTHPARRCETKVLAARQRERGAALRAAELEREIAALRRTERESPPGRDVVRRFA